MSRSVIAMGLAALLLALPGCAVTTYGQQTVGGASNVTSTGSSVRGGTRIGNNARISGSFGTPPAYNAPGGQATLAGNASAVVVAALVIAGLMEVVDDWLRPVVAANETLSGRLPTGNISHTCSCYGWEPEAASASGRQPAPGF